MIKQIAAMGLVGSLLFSCETKNETGGRVELNSTIDSLSYAIGLGFADQIIGSGFDSLNGDVVSQAIKDKMASNDSILTEDEIKALFTDFSTKMQEKSRKKMLSRQREVEDFLHRDDVNGGIQTTASGLQYQVMIEGSGEKPTPSSTVDVHYHGLLKDSTVFDSSVLRGQTAQFGVNQVIPGWVEGLQLMTVGSKFKFIIPSALAYGENGAGGKIGPNEDLIFFVELFEIK